MATRKPALKTRTAVATPKPDSEAQWRARSDMHTLKEAHQIQSDKARLAAATKHAKAELQAMSAVAGKK